MRQGPTGRRGSRRPHSGGEGRSNHREHREGGNGHHRNGGEPQRRSAVSLRNQSFDSNGPDVRVRGNAWQVHEKYQSLARDAQMSGDRVAAENLLQHAEHYYRIIEAINEATAAEQAVRGVPAPAPQAYAGHGSMPAPPQGNGSHYMPQPDARGLYPQVPLSSAPPMAQEEAQVISSNPMGQTQNPFFTPDEAEAETEPHLSARVSSF
jgi:hypothetical protein